MEKKAMQKEAAFEMDCFLPLLKAGIAAMRCVVDKYLSPGDQLRDAQVAEMGDAMLAVDIYLSGLHDEARARVDKTFAIMQKEKTVKKRGGGKVIYERKPRWMKALAALGVMLYAICAGIGCGWVVTKLIEMIG